MSVKGTRIRIAAILNAGKTALGLNTAYSVIPRAIPDAQLPAAVIMPGVAADDTDVFGDETNQEVRTYEVHLFVERAAFGVEGEYQDNVEDLIEQVKGYLRARPGLELEGESEPQTVVYDARVTGDRGVQFKTWGGTEVEYIGSTVLVRVTELSRVVYQD